ncbi:MAG: DUF4417 domain-containing protein [Clostridia bacterium]|nr:DUF4417 domain-containing protein [Clostridia bacterium]
MYRQSRMYENLNKRIFEGVGSYSIPKIQPETCDIDCFVGVNYAKTEKSPEHKGLHFFVDDYQFERFWTNPDAYIDILKRFDCVLSPDFSTYTDFPKIIQIYNHYRKHWLAAYWQEHGIKVIPSISWSDEDSFKWCFDGEPVGGVVAVSSVSTQKTLETKELFIKGYTEMLKRLTPKKIIFFGSVPEECEGDIVRVGAYQDKFRRNK